MRRPVNAPYQITTEFGVKDSYALFGYHSGVDYAVETGRQIFAPASGSLTNVVSKTGGNMVVIYDGQFYHRLMHNSSFSRGNGWVNEGDEVARCGTTGLSTGPHCHWDININGQTARSFSDFRSPADWLAGKFLQVTTPQGGNEVFQNIDEVKEAYRQMRGAEGTDGEMRPWIGQSKQRWIQLSTAETNSTRQQLADVRAALANEQAKPPKEVIKEVQVIVEKPVEVIKEVPVYTHDEATAQNVNKILAMVTKIYNYFKGQFKTFTKYDK
jgi:hypothetical protein